MAVAGHEDFGVDAISEAFAHLGTGNVPPAMDEQRGHLGIGEAEGAEHDHPVDAVGWDKDVLAYDMQGRPAGFEKAEIGSRLGVVAGEADVVRECVEPDIGHKGGIKRKLDAPGEAGFRAGNAEVSGELLHGISKLRDAEIGDDERIPRLCAGVDEIEEPVAVLGEFEVVVFFLDLDDLAPLGAELAVGAAFFFGEELLLTHAVVAALRGFVEFAFVPESLQHALHAGFVQVLHGGGPGVMAEVEFFPEFHEEGGDFGNKLGRFHAALLGGLLHLLSVLVHACEEENLASGEALVAGDGVSEDLFIGMADVRRAISVVDRGSDEECVRHGVSGIDFDFSAPGEDAGFAACGFGFLDLVVADMEEREAGPGEHVLRTQLHGLQPGFHGLGVAAVFHERHAECVPSLEEFGIHLDTTAVFLDRRLQIANSDVARGIVENLVDLLIHQPWRPAGMVMRAASRLTRSHSMKRRSRLLRSTLSRICDSRAPKAI